MHRSHHYLAPLFLTAALAAPISIMAAPMPQEAGVQSRVDDKNHRDYHNWDDHENHAWNQYLSENHRESHEYSKSNKREQSQYWNWRHAHPDDDREHRDNNKH
jgi:carboxypeptidase C (cathepsin A)